MKAEIKVGFIQMEILSNIFDGSVRAINVKHACQLMEDLLEKNKDLDLLVLPEEFYAGAGYGPISLQDGFDLIKETVISPFGEIAAKYHVNITGALSTKFNEVGFKANNIAFVLNRSGKLIGTQERFHLAASEQPFSFSGEKFEIFDLDFGRVGIVIGVDILYPEVARKFVLEGAEILINPIIEPGEKDENSFPNTLYKNCAITRAMENQVYVVMVNGVGKFAHVDMDIFGESLAAGPKGLIKKMDFNEGCDIAELSIEDKQEVLRNLDIMELRNTEICAISK
jgi:predicted amidohydrolase